MTVGELKKKLEGLPDDWEIKFGLQEIDRLKKRDDKLVDVELFPLVARESNGRYFVVPDSDPEVA
jgi:hypothetical protein